MADFTKRAMVMQYTEIVYYRDGEEIGREKMHDDSAYDADPPEPMSEQEIEDWG